jgi:DNA-binding NarL/FixJ family response regulator
MSIRIVVAEDHAVVREGLRMFLGLDPEFEIVGEAQTGRDAIELARSLHPDVVLMDLLMPGVDGITATAAIREAQPDVEVVALTSVLEDASVAGAIRAGAVGYLLKNASPDELRSAIRAAAQGQVRLSPEAAARLVREVRAPESPEALTKREIEVLRLVAAGRANKEIARELEVAEQTIKTHVSSVLSKLGVQSRTQAALHAFRIGLVSGSEVALT